MAKGRKPGFEAVLGTAGTAAERRALTDFAEGVEHSLRHAGCPDIDAKQLATMRLVADLACDRAINGQPLDSSTGPIDLAVRFTGLPEPTVRAMVAHIALRDARTAAQPSSQAIGTQLRIVASLAPVQEASFWRPAADGQLECVAHVNGTPSPSVARVARKSFAMATQTPVSRRRELVSVPVEGDASPCGVLAARTEPGQAGIATIALRAAAPLIRIVLERDALLSSAEARGAGAAQRALVRFGFDVHDGPAQEIAALQAEIRHLEGQVAEAFAEDPRADLLLGRLQDLEARSAAVAEQIRGVARAALSPARIEEPVEEVLRAELRELRRAAQVEGDLQLSGPVDEATQSQRIALLRGIQEALRNVREHSGARRVWIRIEAGEDRIEAEVEDDGRGFEVERASAEARAAGRMGLAGMVERARLLGGECEVRSAPGGPTSIRLTLPRWDPQPTS